jgi:hypothetical protein
MSRVKTYDVVLLSVEALQEGSGSPTRSKNDKVLLLGVLLKLLSGEM